MNIDIPDELIEDAIESPDTSYQNHLLEYIFEEYEKKDSNVTSPKNSKKKMTIKETHEYEVIDFKCVSGGFYRAHIPGVISGSCQCGNCKVKIRNYRYHPGAFGGDNSFYDYIFDVEEVQRVAENGQLRRKKTSDN